MNYNATPKGSMWSCGNPIHDSKPGLVKYLYRNTNPDTWEGKRALNRLARNWFIGIGLVVGAAFVVFGLR